MFFAGDSRRCCVIIAIDVTPLPVPFPALNRLARLPSVLYPNRLLFWTMPARHATLRHPGRSASTAGD